MNATKIDFDEWFSDCQPGAGAVYKLPARPEAIKLGAPKGYSKFRIYCFFGMVMTPANQSYLAFGRVVGTRNGVSQFELPVNVIGPTALLSTRGYKSAPSMLKIANKDVPNGLQLDLSHGAAATGSGDGDRTVSSLWANITPSILAPCDVEANIDQILFNCDQAEALNFVQVRAWLGVIGLNQ